MIQWLSFLTHVTCIYVLRIQLKKPLVSCSLYPIPSEKFLDYSLNFVTDLFLAAGCNSIVTIVDQLTKWATLIPCHMGPDHPLGAEEVALLFFHYVEGCCGGLCLCPEYLLLAVGWSL